MSTINNKLLELLKFAQTTIIVAKREDAIFQGMRYDEANDFAKNSHQVLAISKAIAEAEQQEETVDSKRTPQDFWYARNPQHEINADTGKDMFYDTAFLVMEEYADFKNKLLEAAKQAKHQIDYLSGVSGIERLSSTEVTLRMLKEAIAEAEQQEETKEWSYNTDENEIEYYIQVNNRIIGSVLDENDAKTIVTACNELPDFKSAYNTACSKIDELNERIAEQDNEIRLLQNDYEAK